MSPEDIFVAACRIIVLGIVSAAGAAWYQRLVGIGLAHQEWLTSDETAHKIAAAVWALHLAVAAGLIVTPLAAIIWRAVS